MQQYSYNEKYQHSFYEVINHAVREFPRTLALRVDLRFPGDYRYDRSSKDITRFAESLKAKLKVDCRYKNRRWRRNWHNRLRYVWVREIGENNFRKHYHILLLLNKDLYHGAGRYRDDDSLASLIQEAWCSALGLDPKQYAALVHMPEKGCYYLNGNSPDYREQVRALMKRMDYLAKDHTKCYDDGYRSIGKSRE